MVHKFKSSIQHFNICQTQFTVIPPENINVHICCLLFNYIKTENVMYHGTCKYDSFVSVTVQLKLTFTSDKVKSSPQ